MIMLLKRGTRQMDLKEKIKLIRKASGLTQPKISELVGIPLNSVRNYERGERGVSALFLLKICEIFPQYTLWLMTNEVAPEVGQISPEQEMPQMASVGVPEKLLDDAFEQTMSTAIALSWLTPKEGLEFSMLNDLHRHNFVEAGGILFAQDSAQDESKTG